MHDDTVQILTDLEFITDHWNDLLEARRPGTSRPWRQALIDPEARAQQAARDRAERQNRDPDAPGFTSAPQHVDVLDVIVDCWVILDEIAEVIARATVDTRPPSIDVRRVTVIAELAAFIRRRLDPALDNDQTEPRINRLGRRLSRQLPEITRVLGLVRAGQMLSGATCPWCRGCTPKHPAGGAVTMRVEEIPGSANLNTEPIAAVVCWNPLCTPPDDAFSISYSGRPAWSQHEWDWLANRLITADPPARTVMAPPETSITPIVHSGRSGVDQALCVAPPRTAPRPADTFRGEPVRFVGGPFNRQVRRFLDIQDHLAVAATAPTGRPRLATSDTDDKIGDYLFAIVNEQPSYVWTAPSSVESETA